MQYKGNDLDLRTPPRQDPYRDDADPYAVGRWPRAPLASRAEPLMVDDVVLAAANHAYDIALAHGAGEVRLDHLVHALTRVDAAAQVLERRGIREGQLRRDSAALIANDAPIGLGADRFAPRRSEDLEEALRRAAHVAGRRGEPATVEDVLWVLLTHPRDSAAVALLRAHAPDWHRADWVRSRDRLPRGEPRIEHRSEPRPAPRLEAVVLQDALTSRIDGVEGALRSLHSELAVDRKAMSDLIRELQRDIAAHRTEVSALRGDLGDRMQSFERAALARHDTRLAGQLGERMQAMETKLADLMRLWSLSSERLQSVERAVDARLADAARMPSLVVERVEALEASMTSRLSSLPDASASLGSLVSQLSERLGSVEITLNERAGGTADLLAIADRVHTLEKAVHSGLGEGARNWSALATRLQSIEAAVARVGEAGALIERLAAAERLIDQRTAEAQRGTSLIADRLLAMEKTIRAGGGDGAAVWPQLGARLQTLERMIETRASESGSQTRVLSDRLRTIEEQVAAQRAENIETRSAIAAHLKSIEAMAGGSSLTGADVAGLESAIGNRILLLKRDIDAERAAYAQPVVQRISDLEAQTGSRHTELANAFGFFVQRLGGLEQSVQTTLRGLGEASTSQARELAEVQEVVLQLTEHQNAITQSLSDWREETKGDLSIISNQMKELLAARTAAPDAIVAVGPSPVAPPSTPAPGSKRNGTGHGGDVPPGGPGGTGRPAPATVAPAKSPGLEPTPTPRIFSTSAAPAAAAERAAVGGFWWWLFGTSSVRRANQGLDVRWDRMRDRLQTRKE